MTYSQSGELVTDPATEAAIPAAETWFVYLHFCVRDLACLLCLHNVYTCSGSSYTTKAQLRRSISSGA